MPKPMTRLQYNFHQGLSLVCLFFCVGISAWSVAWGTQAADSGQPLGAAIFGGFAIGGIWRARMVLHDLATFRRYARSQEEL